MVRVDNRWTELLKETSAAHCQHWVKYGRSLRNCQTDGCNRMLLGKYNIDHMTGLSAVGERLLVTMPYTSAAKPKEVRLLDDLALTSTVRRWSFGEQHVFVVHAGYIQLSEKELDDVCYAAGKAVYTDQWKESQDRVAVPA